MQLAESCGLASDNGYIVEPDLTKFANVNGISHGAVHTNADRQTGPIASSRLDPDQPARSPHWAWRQK